MPYTLRRYPAVKRQLLSVPSRIRADVDQAIFDLQYDPYPPTSVGLREQYAMARKITIDGWRILYEVKEQDKRVDIIAVKPRDKDTYTKLT
jgi:mRNA-degrading endonuclease RelE of RelBE toxin-antitoxin system